MIYSQATREEYEKSLVFANFVFSQAHVPHDFRRLLPKTYGDADSFMRVPHFIAKREDGDIRALVSCRPTELAYRGETLHCGFVGTVSVHMYSRGEGHMKRLMADMLEDGRRRGYDMLILGGQRQRYNYFGFENCGLRYNFNVNGTNLRHCCADVDAESVTFAPMTQADVPFAKRLFDALPMHGVRAEEEFLTVLRSWSAEPLLVSNAGVPIGYVAGGEWVLEDEDMLPMVLKAYLPLYAKNGVTIGCGISETKRIEILRGLCGSVSVSHVEMVNILNWERVLETLLRFKAAYMPLEDGERTLDIEGYHGIHISVKDNRVSVTPCGGAGDAMRLDHMEAQRLFFSMTGLTSPRGLPLSWTPLPFVMSGQDGY